MEHTIREKIIAELHELFDVFVFERIPDPVCYRGRQIFDTDSEPPPLITILPRVEQAERTDYAITSLTMPVDVICLANIRAEDPDDSTVMIDHNPSELGEAILGELIACVFGKEGEDEDGKPVKLGGISGDYADEVRYRSGGIDAYPDELGQQILHVGITIEVRYRTNQGDPYSN